MNLDTIDTMAKPMKESPNRWLDFCGLAASIGCAIHCAMMPLVIAYLPSLGLSWFADEAFHFWMAIACFVIAFFSFVPGFRRHRNPVPLLLGMIGIGVLFGHSSLGCECCSDENNNTSLSQPEPCPYCSNSEDANQRNFPEVDISSTKNSRTTKPELPVWLIPLSPWLPPIGGLFLIAAHLVNHFKGCCACCKP